MGMTTVSLRKDLEKIRELEADVRIYKEKKHLYETLLLTDGLSDEEYSYAQMKADYYQHAFNLTCNEIRELKVKLSEKCNVEAFGYDSPGIVDDSYYEKRLKNNGYLVGIRL